MKATDEQHRAILQRIARSVMVERGLLPDFSAEALTELGRIQAPAAMDGGQVRDLRHLLWASIDNDDSRDLDQLTVAEAMPGDNVKVLVAVADVDSVVKNGSAIDGHARHNTTSVYTAAAIFPMLPEKLSTDIITQRLLKAALDGQPVPYDEDDLEALAKHCTEEEDAARKVERQVGKSAAAVLLESRIGQRFDAIVTGAGPKGTWVRVLAPPVEGRLVQGFEGIDVGHRIRVALTRTDVEQGFIDFKNVG